MRAVTLLALLALSIAGAMARDFPAPELSPINEATVAMKWQDFADFSPAAQKVHYEIQHSEPGLQDWKTAHTTLDAYGHFSVKPDVDFDVRVVVSLGIDDSDTSNTTMISFPASFSGSTQLEPQPMFLWTAPVVSQVRTNAVLIEFHAAPGFEMDNATYVIEKDEGSGFEVAATRGFDPLGTYSIVLQRIQPGVPTAYRIVFERDMVPVMFSEIADLTTTVYPSFLVGGSDVTTLMAVADTFVSEHSPTLNHGLDPTMQAGRSKGAGDRLALVKFDLSGIPSNRRIVRATLGLYMFENLPYETRIYMNLDQDWEETVVTWNTRPRPLDIARWEADLIPPADGSTFVEYPLDLLHDTAVQTLNRWHDSPSTNFGFMVDVLSFSDAFPFLEFGSKEGMLPPAVLTLELDDDVVVPTSIPVPTPTATPDTMATPVPTPSPTAVPSASILPPPAATPTPEPTNTPVATTVPTPTATPVATAVPTPPVRGDPIGVPVTEEVVPNTVISIAGDNGDPVLRVDLSGENVGSTLVVEVFAAPENSGLGFGTPILSLTLLNEFGDETQPSDTVEVCFSGELIPDSDKACLGFLDESRSPPQWVCEDNCLDEENGLVCGDTDHFTDFAVLLTGSQADECVDGANLIFSEYWQDLILVLLVLGVVLVIATVVALMGTYVPFCRDVVYGTEGTRIRELRAGSVGGAGNSDVDL